MEHRIFRLLFYAMTGDTFVWKMFLNFWMDIRMMGSFIVDPDTLQVI